MQESQSMVVDLNYPIRGKISRHITDMTEMIREEEASEFLAHGITVEESY